MSDARRTGRTTAICKAAREIGALVVCATHRHSRQVSREHGVESCGMEQADVFFGRTSPILWDHHAVDQLLLKNERLHAELKCANDQIAARDERIQKLRLQIIEVRGLYQEENTRLYTTIIEKCARITELEAKLGVIG